MEKHWPHSRHHDLYFESGMWKSKAYVRNMTFTSPTGTDFKKASSQALLWTDAETLISRVFLFAGKNRAWWCEAVSWDSFHLYVFLKLHVDRPGEKNKNITGRDEIKFSFLRYFISGYQCVPVLLLNILLLYHKIQQEFTPWTLAFWH